MIICLKLSVLTMVGKQEGLCYGFDDPTNSGGSSTTSSGSLGD
jgi:hypothetical protein